MLLRMNRISGAAFVAGTVFMLSGCASTGAVKESKEASPEATPVAVAPPPVAEKGGWRNVATVHDKDRIRNWYTAWKQALEAANQGGYGAQVSEAGDVLRPDAALPNPHLPPGNYKCRTIKLGSKSGGTLTYVSYPWFTCRVTAEQNLFSFVKLTGSQRTTGLIFEDDDRRQIFLGTMVLGDESGPRDYGVDEARDMAGIVERVGAQRWRIVFPYPAYESIVDVLEIAP